MISMHQRQAYAYLIGLSKAKGMELLTKVGGWVGGGGKGSISIIQQIQVYEHLVVLSKAKGMEFLTKVGGLGRRKFITQ